MSLISRGKIFPQLLPFDVIIKLIIKLYFIYLFIVIRFPNLVFIALNVPMFSTKEIHGSSTDEFLMKHYANEETKFGSRCFIGRHSFWNTTLFTW